MLSLFRLFRGQNLPNFITEHFGLIISGEHADGVDQSFDLASGRVKRAADADKTGISHT